MHTQVGHLCKPVVTVDMDMTVENIIKNSAWDKISSVVVLDKNNKVFGIITESDMIHFEAKNINDKNIKASEICSKKIIKIGPEDSIIGAAHLMIDNNVHHVLIMVGDYVEGIISTLDVLKQILETE